jgi:hypothetical protein
MERKGRSSERYEEGKKLSGRRRRNTVGREKNEAYINNLERRGRRKGWKERKEIETRERNKIKTNVRNITGKAKEPRKRERK